MVKKTDINDTFFPEDSDTSSEFIEKKSNLDESKDSVQLKSKKRKETTKSKVSQKEIVVSKRKKSGFSKISKMDGVSFL